jgi:16S rRNA (uracil1498-N3)-methyltransferase
MQKHIFFQPDLSSGTVELNEEETHHCMRVLRIKKGGQIALADGKGTEALAVIEEEKKRTCRLRIVDRILHHPKQQGRLHLVLAPLKNNERMEWFVEKATELGLDELSFILCEHSERSRINMERLQKVAISAMKQSQQWFLPLIHEPVRFNDFIQQAGGLKLIAACEVGVEHHIASQLTLSSEQVCVMIGPEGDFSTDELKEAESLGFIPVSLGKSILRSETAALYVCALMRPAV